MQYMQLCARIYSVISVIYLGIYSPNYDVLLITTLNTRKCQASPGNDELRFYRRQ